MEINISIVDDEKVMTDMLVSYLARFEAEPDIKDVHFKINTYSDGLDFLASYPANADIVLMDIDMPRLDGMKTAEKLRAMDEYVTIIFVTNLSQFAVKGYEVGVQDFLVKPVVYPNFAAKIRRALERLENVRDEKNSGIGRRRVKSSFPQNNQIHRGNEARYNLPHHKRRRAHVRQP